MPRKPKTYDRSMVGYTAKDFRRMGFDLWEIPDLLNIRRLWRKK